MMDFASILDAFEDALELERELGNRIVECDRSLLAAVPSTAGGHAGRVTLSNTAVSSKPPYPQHPPLTSQPSLPNSQPSTLNPQPSKPVPDFAFLLECEPTGPVAELLPKMSEAIGYGRDGVKINDPSAKVLIVLGAAALQKWLPGTKAIPGQWVKRGDTPALVTASPTKTYRFFANDPAKILALKRRLWADLKAALARIGKTPPPKKA